MFLKPLECLKHVSPNMLFLTETMSFTWKNQKFSPLNYVKNVKTPILLLHGKEDPYVPLGQYIQFYRALKDLSKETELLIFPREGHGFSEKEHIRRNMLETLKWFEKHR